MVFIGEAAKLSGASVKAIRHYDGLGLLPDVSRSGSYRVFNERDINLIKLIKQAQSLGFKLSELKEALYAQDDVPSWRQVDTLLKLKESQIAKQIAALDQTRTQLGEFSRQITTCLSDNADCADPLI